MPNEHPKSRRAFTLIELILVLVIMASLIAVASPALSLLNRKSKIDGVARSLVALHKQARQLAMHEGQAYRVVVEPDEYRAWIEVQTAGGYAETREAQSREVLLDKSIALEFGELPAAENGRYALACWPNGVVQPAAITLISSDGREKLVYCPSASEGMVIGEPGDEEPPTWGINLDS